MKTFKATFTEETLIESFGPDWVDMFAVGYPEQVPNPDYVKGNSDFTEKMIPNPDYVPAQGSEQIIDPAWEAPEGYDPEDIENEIFPDMIDNPDYVPASGGEPRLPNPEYKEDVGEEFMANPESKAEWVWARLIRLGIEAIAKPVEAELRRQYGEQGVAAIVEKRKAVIESAQANLEVTE